jgi:hypothetical protein
VLRAADHADLPHPVLGPGRPVGGEAVLAVERLRARVGIGDPQRCWLRRAEDGLEQCPPGAGAVVGCVDVEHVQLPRPRGHGILGRSRHGDPGQLAAPLGDRHAVAAVALAGQDSSPHPLAGRREARVVEHGVRHEPAVRLLPAPHVHARHLRHVLNLGRPDDQRGTHYWIASHGQFTSRYRRTYGQLPSHTPRG